MRRSSIYRITAIALILLGFVAMAAAILTGQAYVGLVLIFPVVVGSGPLPLLAILLLFCGFALLFISSVATINEGMAHTIETQQSVELKRDYPGNEGGFGGVVFIGPIPIVFGSDRRMTGMMMYVGLVMAIILLIVMLMSVGM